MIYFFTGAGISAESGISTFRDTSKTSIWKKYDPDKVANIATFDENKELVYEFYNSRLSEYEPNKAHLEIAKFQKHYQDSIIYTQNVDDLFEKAGCKNIVHVHGSMKKKMCISCNHRWIHDNEKLILGESCPSCNSNRVKYDVVFFGEHAPEYSKMYETFSGLTKDDIIIVIGTSGNVIPFKYLFANCKDSYKILANKNPEFGVDDNLFNKVVYGNITDTIDKVLELVEDKFK